MLNSSPKSTWKNPKQHSATTCDTSFMSRLNHGRDTSFNNNYYYAFSSKNIWRSTDVIKIRAAGLLLLFSFVLSCFSFLYRGFRSLLRSGVKIKAFNISNSNGHYEGRDYTWAQHAIYWRLSIFIRVLLPHRGNPEVIVYFYFYQNYILQLHNVCALSLDFLFAIEININRTV